MYKFLLKNTHRLLMIEMTGFSWILLRLVFHPNQQQQYNSCFIVARIWEWHEQIQKKMITEQYTHTITGKEEPFLRPFGSLKKFHVFFLKKTLWIRDRHGNLFRHPKSLWKKLEVKYLWIGLRNARRKSYTNKFDRVVLYTYSNHTMGKHFCGINPMKDDKIIRISR